MSSKIIHWSDCSRLRIMQINLILSLKSREYEIYFNSPCYIVLYKQSIDCLQGSETAAGMSDSQGDLWHMNKVSDCDKVGLVIENTTYRCLPKWAAETIRNPVRHTIRPASTTLIIMPVQLCENRCGILAGISTYWYVRRLASCPWDIYTRFSSTAFPSDKQVS